MTINPTNLYIDRRKGFDPTRPHSDLLGSEWIKRGTDPYWLVHVIPNEKGYLIEQTNANV